MPQRVVPEQQGDTHGPIVLSQSSATLDEPSGTVTVTASNGSRPQIQHKVWVAEAVPPTTDTSDPLAAPATARIYYYRQHDYYGDDEPSAFMAFLAGLLCMPRVGSWRLRLGSRELSVDSVDFVSEWHKAQAEAALHPVAPALKRPSDVSPLGSHSGLAPHASGELLARSPQTSRLAPRSSDPLPPEPEADPQEVAELAGLTHVMSIRSPAEAAVDEEAERTRSGSSATCSSRTPSSRPGSSTAPGPQGPLVQYLQQLGSQGQSGAFSSRPTSKRSVRWG